MHNHVKYTYGGWYQAVVFGQDSITPTTYINPTNEDVNNRWVYLRTARHIAASINNVLKYGFVPELKKRSFHAGRENNEYIMDYGRTLELFKNPLHSLSSVTLGDGTVLTPPTGIITNPENETPYTALRIVQNAGSFNNYADDWYNAIKIDGIWGYNTSSGFILSGDTVANATQISASATALTVTDANGNDSNLYAPRFDVGQVIRIDDEYCIIADIDYTTNVLTIIRGQLGTTAAIHLNGVAIYTWQVQPEIVEAATVITNYEIGRRSSFNTLAPNATGYNSNDFPEYWPQRATEILNRFAPGYIGSV